jgi:hypothetical protein
MQGAETSGNLYRQHEVHSAERIGEGRNGARKLAGIIVAAAAVAFGPVVLLFYSLRNCGKKAQENARSQKPAPALSTPEEPFSENSGVNSSRLKVRTASDAASDGSTSVMQQERLHLALSVQDSLMHAMPALERGGEPFVGNHSIMEYSQAVTGVLDRDSPRTLPEGQGPCARSAAAEEQLVSLQAGHNGMQASTSPSDAGSADAQHGTERRGDESPQAFLPFFPQAFVSSDPAAPSPFRLTPEIMIAASDCMSSQGAPGASQELIMQSFGAETNKDIVRVQSPTNASDRGTSKRLQA